MDHKQASVSNPNNKNRVTQQSTMAPRAHQQTTTLCHYKPYPCPCCFLLALFVVRLLWGVSECSSLLLSTDNLGEVFSQPVSLQFLLLTAYRRLKGVKAPTYFRVGRKGGELARLEGYGKGTEVQGLVRAEERPYLGQRRGSPLRRACFLRAACIVTFCHKDIKNPHIPGITWCVVALSILRFRGRVSVDR